MTFSLTCLLSDHGEALVELINGLLPDLKVEGKDGTVHVIKALKEDFFIELAKAAIKVDVPKNPALNAEVTKWHVETGDTLMFILDTVLTKDFLNILCTALGINAKNEQGEENQIYNILMSLVDKEEEILDLLIDLLAKYLVEYKAYKQQPIDKTQMTSESTNEQFNSIVSNLDALIPTILSLVGLKDSEGKDVTSLEDLINGFLNDSIADMLVGMIAELLSGLKAEDIDPILGYVRSLTNLTDLDIAPKAFANDFFGSKVKQFFADTAAAANTTIDKLTWAQVWTLNSHEVTDAEGKVTREFNGYNWGVKSLRDLINLVCDFIKPLDCVLAVLIQGGQVESEFIASGKTSVGKPISALDEINIMGGMGYNYAILPLLELLGVDAMSQDTFDATVLENNGSVLYPILDMLDTAIYGSIDSNGNRQDDGILKNPINWLTSILANLCYVLGNDDITTIVDNLIAPVNQLIAKVDKIIPIAIEINLGYINTDKKVVQMYLGTEHPGIESGIHIIVKGDDIAALLENLLATLEIEGKALGIKVDLDWLALVGKAGKDANGDGKVDFSKTRLDDKFDIFNGTTYSTIVGDPADTFVTLLDVVIGEKGEDGKTNIDRILEALGVELSPEIKDIIDQVVEDPSKIIDLIAGLLGETTYQPVQNRPIAVTGEDYRGYLTFTEQNADIIANNLDALIVDILNAAGVGSLRGLLAPYISNKTVNQLLDMIIGLLAGDSVGPILETVASLNLGIEIPLTLKSFSAKISELAKTRSYLKGIAAHLEKAVKAGGDNANWSNVTSLQEANINWEVTDGNTNQFTRALAGFLTPLNDLFELLLIGESTGIKLDLLGIAQIGGGNGYDYAIIPLLEALGFPAEQVLTHRQFMTAVEKDETQLLGYLLNKVAELVNKILDRPIDTILGLLPNLAYFFSNEGLLLTVKNLIAPIYTVLITVTNVLGVNIESYLKLEELLHSIDLGIVVGESKYDFRIPVIDWHKLATKGGDKAQEVNTSRSYEANSYVQEMKADEYAAYTKANPDAAHKTTQKHIVADKGDTLTVILAWVFDMFGDAHNREALVQWIVDFFDLKSGAEETVRYAINQLFNQAEMNNSTDILVSALMIALGVGVGVDKAIMGDIKSIVEIYRQLFGAIGDGSGSIYGSIASAMEELTGVWYDTIGTPEEGDDVKDEVEENLNWFQRLFKKIKEFFQKIFGIFG